MDIYIFSPRSPRLRVKNREKKGQASRTVKRVDGEFKKLKK